MRAQGGRFVLPRAALAALLLLSTANVYCHGTSRRQYPPPEHVSSATPLDVIAYYPVWASCDMPPQKLDWSAFTHLIFFWGEPSLTPPYFNLALNGCDSTIFENGGVCGGNGWCLNPLDNGSNGLTNQKILHDSAAAHGVKLLLSVGGEVGNPAAAFTAMIADTAKQDLFLDAVLGFARRHGYQGIDIDWEYPTRGADGRAAYNRFLTKLRAGLDGWAERGVLSMAVPTWYWWDHPGGDPLIDTATINRCVDFVDLMEYGMQNGDQISHYSPLHPNPAAPNQETWDLRGVNEWKGAGVDPSRIVTLIPFEAIRMTDVSGSSPVEIGHAGSNSQWIGIRDIPPSAVRHWDDAAKATWAEEGTTFYSFEDSASIAAKVQYARDQRIAGVGIWELWRGWLPGGAPGLQDPLLQSLKKAVGGVAPRVPRLKGSIFFDRDGNGVRDPGEEGMPGWRVRVSGPVADAAISDSSGSYVLYDLPQGTYDAAVEGRALWSQTLPPAPAGVTVGTDTAAAVIDFGLHTALASARNVRRGWNIVSVPLVAPDLHPGSLFPPAASAAFAFSGGYAVADTFDYQGGYWLRFPQTETVFSAGTAPIAADTTPLVTGWNMIGAQSGTRPADAVTTIPDGILGSRIWDYDRGYKVADSLRPGKGYWVKALAPGSMLRAAAGALARAASPPPVSRLTFTSGSGESAEVFFSSDPGIEPLLGSYDLPPLPPGDMLDARFATGAAAYLPAGRDLPLYVRPAGGETIVSWDLDLPACRLDDPEGGTSIMMSGKGSAKLAEADGPLRTMRLRAFPGAAPIPAQRLLVENFPNPFNGGTRIGVTLPEEGRVRLQVFDVLGREVQLLLDRIMKAGNFDVPFEPSPLAGGVYFCRVSLAAASGAYRSAASRMIVVK